MYQGTYNFEGYSILKMFIKTEYLAVIWKISCYCNWYQWDVICTCKTLDPNLDVYHCTLYIVYFYFFLMCHVRNTHYSYKTVYQVILMLGNFGKVWPKKKFYILVDFHNSRLAGEFLIKFCYPSKISQIIQHPKISLHAAIVWKRHSAEVIMSW